MSPAFRGSSVLMDTEIQNWLVYNYIISNSRCYCYFLLLLLASVVVVELWFLKIKFCLSRTQIKKRDDEELLLLLLSSKTYYSGMEWWNDGCTMEWWIILLVDEYLLQGNAWLEQHFLQRFRGRRLLRMLLLEEFNLSANN